jgi:hypothetical protein
MLATIRFRTFHLLVSILRTKWLKHTKLYFWGVWNWVSHIKGSTKTEGIWLEAFKVTTYNEVLLGNGWWRRRHFLKWWTWVTNLYRNRIETFSLSCYELLPVGHLVCTVKERGTKCHLFKKKWQDYGGDDAFTYTLFKLRHDITAWRKSKSKSKAIPVRGREDP